MLFTAADTAADGLLVQVQGLYICQHFPVILFFILFFLDMVWIKSTGMKYSVAVGGK